jgi:hypothetical protein
MQEANVVYLQRLWQMNKVECDSFDNQGEEVVMKELFKETNMDTLFIKIELNANTKIEISF